MFSKLVLKIWQNMQILSIFREKQMLKSSRKIRLNFASKVQELCVQINKNVNKTFESFFAKLISS